MYESFYSLSANPFKLSPDHRFFYGSRSHSKAMAYLRYGLAQGEGFIVITGDIGTGKSTLVERLFAELDTTRYIAARIATTNIDADDAIRLILAAFNISSASSDKAALLTSFESFLVEQHKANRRVLLVIDEAQNLPMRTIEELRMLSNFQVGGQSLFQSFLLGQPQFKALLSHPNLEQLRQRVIASYNLEPISLEETKAYIEHRLGRAGWSGRPSISPRCFELIYKETKGTPRRINGLCGRLLMYGALEELDHLDEEAVAEVIADLRSEVAESASSKTKPMSNGSGVDSSGMGGHAAAPAERDADLPDDLAPRLERLEKAVALHEQTLRQVLDTAVGYLSAWRPSDVETPQEETDNDSKP